MYREVGLNGRHRWIETKAPYHLNQGPLGLKPTKGPVKEGCSSNIKIKAIDLIESQLPFLYL